VHVGDLDGDGDENMAEDVEESISRGHGEKSSQMSNDGCDDAFDEGSHFLCHNYYLLQTVEGIARLRY
jgi:hypothetical protein